jgi:hypothetical protein
MSVRFGRPATIAFGVLLGLVGLAVLTVPAARDDDHGTRQGHDAQGSEWRFKAPLEQIHLYLCAFHVAKNNPTFQIEAHHYCSPAGQDVHQCVIYDGNGSNARLLGTEYIITDEAYRKLPPSEKKYWHPHAYEILSGQLVAPEAPDLGDALFGSLITTWGKTFHTWPDPTTPVPMGEPLLMWSANGDGQIDQALIDKRDARLKISTATIRQRRKSMGYDVPQIPPPQSTEEIGRQWAKDGIDQPTKRK